MVFTKVVENTIKSTGEINSKVRIRSPTLSEAKNRAIRRAFLYNGFAPVLRRKENVEVEVTNTEDLGEPIGMYLWLIEVKITGVN